MTNPFLKEYASDHNDEVLIREALSGRKTALEELLRKHQPYIYNIAWKMTRNHDDAADLTQEAMIRITTGLSGFSFRSQFRTWAYRIVVNHFLSGKKRGDESKVSSFEDMDRALSSTPDQPMTPMEQEEQQALIREMNLGCMAGMLLCLNREQRMIYIIGELFGGDHTVGSEIMSISKDNFRAKLSKSRKDLYQFMNDRCGLVKKENPCRCHKKVKVLVANGRIDARNLLFNRKEFSSFRRALKPDADYLLEDTSAQYARLHRESSFKTDFDRKTFIEEILASSEWKQRLDL